MTEPEAGDSGEDGLVGQTVGGSYRIVRVVGEGGMGTVYEAEHVRIDTRRFAVKTLHAQHVRDAKAVERFRREAEAAASIANPHVARVVDVGTTDDGTPYIVGDFLDGEDLGAHLDRVGRLPVGDIVRIVRQMCKGLAAAHARGVVHRDIKPENIFLTGDAAAPTARVLDFGISRVDSGGTQLTKTGIIMGTPAYMAPEQARGQRVDERADVYATGAVLYRGLTGSVPFDRPDPPSMIAAVLLDDPPPARSFVPEIDESLELVLQHAMTKDPDERFQTIGELDEALAPFDVLSETPRPPAATLSAPDLNTASTALSGSPAVTAPVTMEVPRPAAGGRTPQLSAAWMTGDGTDAQTARVQLVMYGLAAAVAVVIAAWTVAGATVALVRGGDPAQTLSSLESGLVVLVLVLFAATPGFLLVGRLRSIWSSTMKVLQLLQIVRARAVAAALAYGAAHVVIRTVELVVLRHVDRVAWPGWDLVLVAVAVLGAMSAGRRDPEDKRSRAWALPRTVPFAAGAGAMLLGIVSIGIVRGGEGTSEQDDIEENEAKNSKEKPRPRLAPPDAVASARASGLDALVALGDRYPEDPSVLTALARAQNQVKGGTLAALSTIRRLLKADVDAAATPAIQDIVRRAATRTGPAAAIAFSLMASDMGPHGPELLFELAQQPATKAKATEVLAQDSVRALASPALAIALDLSDAKDCAAVTALLERASRSGDDRAVKLLLPYVASGTTKCGFLGLKRCQKKAKCAAQAHLIHQAISAIRSRAAK